MGGGVGALSPARSRGRPGRVGSGGPAGPSASGRSVRSRSRSAGLVRSAGGRLRYSGGGPAPRPGRGGGWRRRRGDRAVARVGGVGEGVGGGCHRRGWGAGLGELDLAVGLGDDVAVEQQQHVVGGRLRPAAGGVEEERGGRRLVRRGSPLLAIPVGRRGARRVCGGRAAGRGGVVVGWVAGAGPANTLPCVCVCSLLYIFVCVGTLGH